MSEGNGYASREDFLAPDERRIKDVVLPVSRKKYRIRSLFENEKEAYEASLMNSKGDISRDSLLSARRRLIALCLCDGKGDRLLSDADAEGLKIKDGLDMAYLQEEIQSFVGFKPGDIEGLVKNSEGAPGGN